MEEENISKIYFPLHSVGMKGDDIEERVKDDREELKRNVGKKEDQNTHNNHLQVEDLSIIWCREE